jgi:hypothetical protein
MIKHRPGSDHRRPRIRKEHAVMYHQPATSPAARHRGTHQPNAASRAAAAASRRSTAGNLRPIFHRAALAAAGTGAAAALALGPSTPSLAAASTTAVTSTSQAGYLVGGNHYQFERVSAVITVPPGNGCTTNQFVADNYRRSGVQLIGSPGNNMAVGVECLHGLDAGYYYASWAAGYSGNTFPHLPTTTGIRVQAGNRIQLTLSYDKNHTVHITAVKLGTSTVPNQTLLSATDSTGQDPGKASYKQAVLGAVAANPLPHPPPPGVPGTLVKFTNCSVRTYADLNGIGINPPPNASWGVQKQVERESPVGGNLIAQPVPPPPATSFDGHAFNIAIYGNGPIGP